MSPEGQLTTDRTSAAAPPATVKKRCDDAALKVYGAELAAEYPTGCTSDEFQKRAAEMIAPSKLTDKRSQKLLAYSGVRIVSSFDFEPPAAGPFEPGYTEEPEAFEEAPAWPSSPPAVIAAPFEAPIYQAPPAPVAIAAPCVLLVGVQVNTQIATSIDEWLKPHIAAALALPDNYDAQKGRNRTWFEAQIAYKNGEQLLGHVLADVTEDGPPAGLYYLSPRHPVAGVVLAAFEAAGATIAIGQI